ncbi:RNA cap guanine-N2 methyltransferase-domain-containing protein [Elsinoe ampelina]|uniref:Trimethylguanosine synthase n=1 Tax=Elsinoe ampelina TaxID=302913 RepID=A0A6A6GQZ7_9PEZI|nr:RNA cap guanine-N2 methyltransferase-domain-containing protein [Elsinoe ampelina]
MVTTRSSLNGSSEPEKVDSKEESAPKNVHHYESAEDMPQEIRKYWHQRYDIFSRWDEGIQLTDESWYGVTPEPVANKIATHLSLSTPAPITTLVDLFAGAGGNAIAFALTNRWTRIFAIERSPAVLATARHNARVYGVEKRIWFIEGDCFDVLRKRLKAVVREGAVLFGSPPWGGPGYTGKEVFGVERMEPYGLGELVGLRGSGGRVVLFLPRTSDLNEVARWWERVKREEGGEGVGIGKVRVVHYCMHGASKALCVYFGDFDFSSLER